MSFDYVIYLILIVVLGVLSFELPKRNIFFGYLLFVIAPLFLTPFWISTVKDFDLFGWFKLYSVILFSLFLLVMETRQLYSKKWAWVVVSILVIINIFEAILAVGLSHEFKTNYAVTIGGALLVLSLPRIEINLESKRKVVEYYWRFDGPTVLGYSLWNLLFCSLFYPQHVFIQCAVLLAPVIVFLYHNKSYVKARVYSLTFYYICYMTYPPLNQGKGIQIIETGKGTEIASLLIFAYLLLLFFLKGKDRVRQIFT